MLISSPIILLVTVLALLYWTHHAYRKYLRYERIRAQFGCPPLTRYPAWDPILGLDYVYAMMKALKQDRFLAFQTETYSRAARSIGAKAWTANFLGNRMVYSSVSENMKALSTSHRDCFIIEPIRVGNGAITPFTGRGVSSSDGPKWHASRELIKPYFERAGFSNLDRLSTHVSRLLDKIPTDGSTVDMQPLFRRWFLDTSTEFLFGETVNSLDHPENDWPSRDMLTVMAGLRLRLQLGSFIFLHRDREWFAACKRIQDFLDGYIDKAYRQLAEEERGKSSPHVDGKPREDFLWTIVRQVPDKLELRTQLTGVWIPSSETTSILLSNTLFALARHPRVVKLLRKEILDYGARPLTFEGLRSLQYLRWTVNESHRLYPVSLQTVRYCNQDTTLPTGGGTDGKSPIYCARGDIVHCNRYLMHRDPAVWGADVESFCPERWAKARPLWNFAPFGGGPRICPAHVMVDTECAYTLFRIFQKFKTVESRDDKPYTAVMRVGPSSKYGCKVTFTLA